MKKFFLIFIIFLPIMICAQEKIVLKTPGAKGLYSSIDPMDLGPDQARALSNFNTGDILGAIKTRRGIVLVTLMDQIDTLLAAFGYYNSFDKYKMLIGVAHQSTGATNHVKVVKSDKGGTELEYGTADSMISHMILAKSDYYDIEKVNDLIIIADGKTVPIIINTEYQDGRDSTETNYYLVDTKFNPIGLSLGFLAPGQLRTVPDTTYSPDDTRMTFRGMVTYKYAFLKDVDASGTITGADSCSRAGLQSVSIIVDSTAVLLTNFEPRARYDTAGLDSLETIIIIRKRFDVPTGRNTSAIARDLFQWKIIDTVVFSTYNAHEFTYLDTINSSTYGVNWVADVLGSPNNRLASDSTIAPPGAIAKDTALDSYLTINSGTQRDSLEDCWLAMSYFDPLTGMESPMGPKILCDSGTFAKNITGTDYLYTWWTPFINTYMRPPWVRIYRSVNEDSLRMIALYDFPANQTNDVAYNERCFYPQFIPDSNLIDASSHSLMVNGWYSFGIGPGRVTRWGTVDLHGYNKPLTVDGLAIDRPAIPYRYGCPLVLSDLVFAMGRVWGIGNPEFPQRLYWSDYGDIGNWNPARYFPVGEDDADECVAVVKLDGNYGDVIVTFKHNSIYMVRGEDPESDLNLYPVTTTYGAINKQSIIKVGQDIYFVSANYDVYLLKGSEKPKLISSPLADGYLDAFGSDILGFRIIDHICWTNGGSVIAFEYKTGAWKKYSYGGVRGLKFSIIYDTTDAAGFVNEHTFIGAGGNELFSEFTGSIDRPMADSVYFPALNYESPCYGDGEYLWTIEEVLLDAEMFNSDTLVMFITNEDGTSVDSSKITMSGDDFNNRKLYQFNFHSMDPQLCTSFKFTQRRSVIPVGELSAHTDLATIYGATIFRKRVKRESSH